MNTAKIKARWASRLMRTKSFVIVTDTESVIYAEHTDASKFDDYMTAHSQLAALRKFQVALNKVVRDFDKEVTRKFDTPRKKKSTTRKINVTTE